MTGTLRTILLLILAVVIAALVVRPASAAPAVRPAAALTKLCDDFWQGWLVAYPTQATVLGDHRYDNRLEDISLAGSGREEARLKSVLTQFAGGQCHVAIRYRNDEGQCDIRLPEAWRVKVSAPLLDSLAQWLDEKNVEVVY